MDKKQALEELAKQKRKNQTYKHEIEVEDEGLDEEDDFVVDDDEPVNKKYKEYDQIEEEEFAKRKPQKTQKTIKDLLTQPVMNSKFEKKQPLPSIQLKGAADQEIDDLFNLEPDPVPVNNYTTPIQQQNNQSSFNKLLSQQYQNQNQGLEKSPEKKNHFLNNNHGNHGISHDENSINFHDLDQLIQTQEKQKDENSLNYNEIENMIQQQSQQKPSQKPQIQKNVAQEFQSKINSEKETDFISVNNDATNILEANSSLHLFLIDITEDVNDPAEIYLFGKVYNKILKKYESCAVIVEKFTRTVYFNIKNLDLSEKEIVDEAAIILNKQCKLTRQQWTYQIEEKKYAFEISEIPAISKYLKVEYSFSVKETPSIDQKNSKAFSAVLGTTYQPVESFIIAKQIKGPQWLEFSKFTIAKGAKLGSSYQFRVPNQQFVQVLTDQKICPSLKVASISVKSWRNDQTKTEEIVLISMVIHSNVQMESQTELQQNLLVKSFVRCPNNKFPINYQKNKIETAQEFENESTLISSFCSKLEQLDPDLIVAHDLYSKLLPLFYQRFMKLNSGAWQKLSRFTRQTGVPRRGSDYYKARMITQGRLLVDTYMSARELIKDSTYTLSSMVEKYLGEKRTEIESDYIQDYFVDQKNIQSIVAHTQNDSYITLSLMLKLQIIQLTKQLTNIAGNTWIRSLQNARAERNEMLLMHEFQARNYIIPDSNVILQNRKNQEIEVKQEDEENPDVKDGKKQKYSGGKVMEPKADLYTKIILLLDFNSLYPSIIIEYNICFTTVERNKQTISEYSGSKEVKKAMPKNKKGENNQNGETKMEIENENESPEQLEQKEIGKVRPDADEGILPQVIKKLIDMRKKAKDMQKQQTDPIKKELYDIRQKAIKLVANSMYGCLGFSSSRFYALGLASLITSKGRDILTKSVKEVEMKNYEVVYGDTDSMMINPNRSELSECLLVAKEIQKMINKNYKYLQIGIDGVFTTLLLVKKKKYAAVKIENLEEILQDPSKKIVFQRELKGIDIVRREFCDLSKKVGQMALDIILDNFKDRDQIFYDLNNLMMQINQALHCFIEGKSSNTIFDPITLKDFIITKQLSRAPHEYGDASLPHVLVAKRMIEKGMNVENIIGHFIYYIICEGQGTGIAQKCFTPQEVKQENKIVDIQYYKQSQIFDPIERLCKNIQGFNVVTLAESLDVSYNKTVIKENKEINSLSTKYRVFRDLQLTCNYCQSISSMYELVDNEVYAAYLKQEEDNIKAEENIEGLINCLKCKTCQLKFDLSYVQNRLVNFIRKINEIYQKGVLYCKSGHTFSAQQVLNENLCLGGCCLNLISQKGIASYKNEYEINIMIQQIENWQKFIWKFIQKSSNNQSKNNQMMIKKQELRYQPEKTYMTLNLIDFFKKFNIL